MRWSQGYIALGVALAGCLWGMEAMAASAAATGHGAGPDQSRLGAAGCVPVLSKAVLAFPAVG